MSLPKNYNGNIITLSQKTLAKDCAIIVYTPEQYTRKKDLVVINGDLHFAAFFWPDIPICREMLENCLVVKKRHEEEDAMLLTAQLEMGNRIARGEV